MRMEEKTAGALLSGKAAPRSKRDYFSPLRDIQTKILSGSQQTVPAALDILTENDEWT